MTINKQFAQDGNALDDCMDQLVEVLAQLLEEPQDPASGAGDQAGATPVDDLRSGDDRVIHVVTNQEE